jgi:hypothetical protein
VEETFGLTFSVSYEYFGEIKHHDLVPNGSTIAVTKQNRQGATTYCNLCEIPAITVFFFFATEYVSLYVQYLLEDSICPQFEAFAKGFRSVMSGPIISVWPVLVEQSCVCVCVCMCYR